MSQRGFTGLQWQQFESQAEILRIQVETPFKTLVHKEKMDETPWEEIQSQILPPWMSRGLIENNESWQEAWIIWYLSQHTA